MPAHLALDAPRDAPASGGIDSIDVCYHCAAAVPARSRWVAVVADVERNFCCAGCQAVAETLHAAGLDGLYGGRTQASIRRERDAGECDRLAAAAGTLYRAVLVPEALRVGRSASSDDSWQLTVDSAQPSGRAARG